MSNGTKIKPAEWLIGIEGKDARELIESDAPVIRVIAGPGSGKTTCLKRRIQRLVQNSNVNPEQVFAGTFTRAIAKELADALGEKVRVSTLHSLAYEMLRKYPAARQGMELRFLLKYEEDTLLYDVGSSDMGGFYERREALRLLQASRSQRMDYENAAFAGEVRRWLQRHGGMLIGEVVYLCVTALESEDIPSGLFDYVVIDEYQDLTAAEQELVNFIWSGNGTLTVLGDNDQSIYGFRFNYPEGIANFDQNWSQCRDLTFSDNRRCGERILDAANVMMAEAGSTKPQMTSKSGRAGELRPVQWKTLDDEINGLASYIRSRAEESFLVLVPRRFIGYRLAEAIGADAQTTFDEEVLEHPIAQEAFIGLSLVAHPKDFVSARAWLGLLGTKGQHGPRRNAEAYASLPAEVGGHELIRQIAGGLITPSGKGSLNMIRRARKAVELIETDATEDELVGLLFDETMAEEEKDDERRRWLIDDLRELRESALEILGGQDSPNLSGVVDTMRYRIATRAPLRNSDEEEPRVRIMTLHSAKGLEADNVVIAGVADQFMPGSVSDATGIAEQRRLLYVAVTRAKDRLIVSWPRLVRIADLMRYGGKIGRVTTSGGVTWGITSRSSLLPQGLTGVVPGETLLG